MDWESLDEYLNKDMGNARGNPKVVVIHDNPLSQVMKEKETILKSHKNKNKIFATTSAKPIKKEQSFTMTKKKKRS